MKTREDIQNMVWDKIREINDGSITLINTHSSDDQFIELVEYFLPQIDETPDGQELADMLFVSRSGFYNDNILAEIKSDLGTLDAPNSKEYVKELKKNIAKNIAVYRKRKSQ
ncbi:hypothetical protein FWF48_01010 [Candidatus Saccharibacteria bacterium]|nr:hypothetical protein [Candidatus Saccharibacteria bacterium]